MGRRQLRRELVLTRKEGTSRGHLLRPGEVESLRRQSRYEVVLSHACIGG